MLILRVGIGLAFVVHGYPKVFEGGAVGLAKFIGSQGIPMAEQAAMMAGLAEFVGGIFFLLGLLFRPTALVMAFTMIVATYVHIHAGDGFKGYSHALESAIMFIAAMITGPGAYSIDAGLFKKKS